MFEKLLRKLAGKLIVNAYNRGWNDGYEVAKEKYNKGAFKKGNVPWNKGRKK